VENRDRRDFDRNRDFDRDRYEERGRRDFDRRNFDRRDFRNDRDRYEARRYFSYRGREYAAVRGPEFRYPRGWAYRRWYRGDVLPSLFIAAPFFFDYGYLGLPPPPPGTRWVRYGPDALLVNVYSGRVVDSIYDAFY
jgi:Ni/Co efflux regulator RcnB